jgi:hypothetical protein
MRAMDLASSILDGTEQGGWSDEDLLKLPTESLERLTVQISSEEEIVKKRKERLYRALHTRFAVNLTPGTHWTDSQGRKVRVEVPKQVEWSQDGLRQIARTIRQQMGESPEDYIEYKLFVPENRYKAWPATIQAMFLPARTVSPGKPKITFVEPNGKGSK